MKTTHKVLLVIVIATISAVMIPSCSLDADHLRIRVERKHDDVDASTLKGDLNEK